MKISEKSTQAFAAACQKLKIGTQLPNVSMVRPDLGLYLTAHYMLAVIIEAGKDGKEYDITNHSKPKWQPWHVADDGYTPGSSAGGFRFSVSVYVYDLTFVGARLCSNSEEESDENAQNYPDLWEIITLIVK